MLRKLSAASILVWTFVLTLSARVWAFDELTGDDIDEEQLREVIAAEIRPVELSRIEWTEAMGSLVIVGVGFALAWLVYHLVKWLAAFAEASKFNIDDLLLRTVAAPVAVFVALLSVYYSLFRIEEVRRAFNQWEGLRDAFFVLTGTWIIASLAKNLLQHYLLPYAESTDTDIDERIVRVLDLVAVYLIWLGGVLIALRSVGIEITGFLASMGILGLAVALAAKTVLSNVLAGVTLTADPNIEIGNRVEVLGYMGDVERINIHKTVIRTRDNLMVSVPNDVLAKEVVVNWDLPNASTRTEMSIGVSYDTDIDHATEVIREVLDEEDDRFVESPAPEVILDDFGDNALVLKIYVWLDDPRRAYRVRDTVHRKILERFREEDIGIPYPQRVVHRADD